MDITIKDLERALLEADKAGDTTSANLFANEIKKIQQSQQPQEGGVISGAQKRLAQVGIGLFGAGARAGEALGIVSPEFMKKYEDKMQQERSVMSPNYQAFTPTGGKEITGSTIADILGSALGGAGFKAAKELPFVGGASNTLGNLLAPTTVPQAAGGGALYSLTTPSESGSEAASKAALGSVFGGGSQFLLRQLGLAPKIEPNLTQQQQEVARRALEQGFQLDPTQITGYGGGLKEGIKSRFPIAREAFTRLEENNQNQTNNIAKNLIKIPQAADLTNESMETAFNSALNNYQVLKSVPAVQGDQKFVTAINNELSRLNKIPKPQLSSDDKKAIRVLKEYKNFGTQAISGEEAFIRSKAIGNNLFQAQKSGSGEAANAFKTLRSAFEQSIEDYLSSPANLMRTNGKATLDQFKDGRKTLSNWYLIDKAFNPDTGNVSAAKLSRELAKKPTYGTTKEPIETAAQLSGAFPKAFPSSGTSEREAYSNIISMLTQAPVAIPAYLATSQPVRNILGQRYLGAKPEGLLGNIYGGISTAGGYLPQPARNAFGKALMSAEQQQLMQTLQPTYGQ
jgi:hypothetical protein